MPGDQGDFAEGGAGIKDFFLSIPQSMLQSWFMRLFGGGGRKLKENLLEAHERIGDAIKKATEALEKGYVEVGGKKIMLSEDQKRNLRKELEKLNREQKKLLKKLSGKSIANIDADPADKDKFDNLFLNRPGVRTRQQQEIDDLVKRQMDLRSRRKRSRQAELSEGKSKLREVSGISKDPNEVIGRKRKVKLAGNEQRERLSRYKHNGHSGVSAERVRDPEGPGVGIYVKRNKDVKLSEKVRPRIPARGATTLHPHHVRTRSSVRKKLVLLSKLSAQVEERGGLRKALAANPRLAVQLKKEFGVEARNVRELADGLRNILGSRAFPQKDISKGIANSLRVVGR